MQKTHTIGTIMALLKSGQSHYASRYGVRRIGVFGSVAHGTAREGSDLDVIVEMDNPSFDRYMDLKLELEERFGMPVDLVLAETLKKRLRPIVEKEAIYA